MTPAICLYSMGVRVTRRKSKYFCRKNRKMDYHLRVLYKIVTQIYCDVNFCFFKIMPFGPGVNLLGYLAL